MDDRSGGGLSGVLAHWPDFAVILVLLFANALVGFTEERSAGKAIDALKAQLAVKAGWCVTASGHAALSELVPGDVIRMRLGDIVPADAACSTATPSRWTSRP